VKKLIIGVIVAVVLIAAASFLSRTGAGGPPMATLPDGKQVIIQSVTYGTNHVFVHGSRLVGKIQTYLPFTRRWLPPTSAMTMNTGEESLLILYSLCEPAGKKYLSLPLDTFNVIDEHGCVLPVTDWGGYHGTLAFSVSTASVRVFPRRQKAFTARMKLVNYPPIDLKIANPLRPNTNHWTPEPLPATRKTNNLTVTLTKIDIHKDRSYTAPWVDIYEDGVKRNTWYGVSRNLRDATGNANDTFLCPYERAWKLELDLYRHADTPFPDSRIWRLTNLVLPEAGRVYHLTNTGHQIGSLLWRPIALCGPGDYVFSNQVCVSSAPWKESTSEILMRSRHSNVEYIFGCKELSLLVYVDGWRDESELLIRAQTPKDGLKPFGFSDSEGKLRSFKLLQPIPAGLAIDLEFIVQQPIHVEFVVQPPRP
jgi:hypothetical protein